MFDQWIMVLNLVANLYPDVAKTTLMIIIPDNQTELTLQVAMSDYARYQRGEINLLEFIARVAAGRRSSGNLSFVCGLLPGGWVGLMAEALFTALYALGHRLSLGLSYRPNRLSSLGVTRARQQAEGTSEDDLLGLARIPWTNLYALSALAGLGLFLLVGPSLGGSRLALLGLPAGVWLLKRYLVHQRRRFMIGQVRQLLVDIRLYISLSGSLLLGLENIARTTGANTPVYRVLNRRSFFCSNPYWDYYRITDEQIHALVANGRHGTQEVVSQG